jgi:hypothetical protein
MVMHGKRYRRPLVAALVTFGLLAGAGSAQAASNIGDPVPADRIVTLNGLDWVYASPCAHNGCSTIQVGKEGFNFATESQWAARPPVESFYGKCASPWFDNTYDHCDEGDLANGFYGSAPSGGTPANGGPMGSLHETLLVRGAGGSTKRCAAETQAYYDAITAREAAYAVFVQAKQDETAAREAYYANRTPENKATWDQKKAEREAARADFDQKKADASAAQAARNACLNPAPPAALRGASFPETLAAG